MVKWMGAAALAAMMMFGALVPIDAAQAASAAVPGARKHTRH